MVRTIELPPHRCLPVNENVIGLSEKQHGSEKKTGLVSDRHVRDLGTIIAPVFQKMSELRELIHFFEDRRDYCAYA